MWSRWYCWNIVINIGDRLSNSDGFLCLVNGGTSGDSYNEYVSFEDALVEDNINSVRNKICESITLSPTVMIATMVTIATVTIATMVMNGDLYGEYLKWYLKLKIIVMVC